MRFIAPRSDTLGSLRIFIGPQDPQEIQNFLGGGVIFGIGH